MADPLVEMYCDAKDRITGLVMQAGPAQCAVPVPACPGWSVRDVVSHLTAVAVDWTAGTLSGPPSDEVTAEHVRRYAARPVTEVLDIWTAATGRLVQLSETDGLEPPLGDVACHEHDIRGALGAPGARDAASVRWTARELLAMLDTPVPLRVLTEVGDYRSGTSARSEITLRTTEFEVMRWRLGRRSRTQLAAMDWSADPAPVLDHLYLFGPAAQDVIE